MDTSRSQKIFPKMEGPIRQNSREGKELPPWLFQHRTLTEALENAKKVNQEALINTFNHIHFMDGYVYALLEHPKYEESILVRAYPEPCLGSELTCHWADGNFAGLKPKDTKFQYVIIVDGRSLILVPAVVQEIDDKRFTIELPSTSHAVGERHARRYTSRDVPVELIQSGFLARGELLDFSPIGFRIRVKPEASSSFQWFNPDESATVHLRKERQILFAGVCECIRQTGEFQEREIVLSPSDEKISRFKKSKIRNPRQQLLPSPTLIFNHPLFGKRVQLEVSDISTSGLSVCEKANEGVLIPGMIIPDLTINFAGLKVKCIAQVIYCLEKEKNGTRCGIAILDMDINAYSRLTNILANAIEPHAYISAEVDIDALWEFFFETDFIYPTKYRLVQSRREEFKKTFQKLYRESPEIARHFTYQENGRIYAHVSMVRAYEKAWMVQHLAARTMDKKLAGFTVLKQILHYLNDMFRLPSANIDYAMVCFRPDKKFPDSAFGGFARALNNPKGCSMDLFSYLPYTTLSLGTRLPEGWSLKQCSSLDLWELGRFYNNHSGGLLLEVMQLTHENSSNESVENLYDRLGFSRRWKAYSLSHYDELNAVLIVEQSDLGLNLSELLNGIKIVVTNLEGLPWDILSTAIGQLAPLYNTDKVPILIYPIEYVNAKAIPYEKQYQLWAYHARFMGQFLEFLKQRIRIHYWE